MKIYRVLSPQGNIEYARPEGSGYVRLEGSLLDGLTLTNEAIYPERILPPIEPKMIFCIGLNYKAHAEEAGSKLPEYPMVFMKNISSVCGEGDPIELPSDNYSGKVDYECELVVVIGKDCCDATVDSALDYVFGYTCANDVSARDWQKEWGGGQFCRAKSFNTFCPLGPCIVTRDEIPNPGTLGLGTKLNGEVVQDANTNDLIFSVPELIAFLSRSSTLPAGSVILTGTPSGVGMGRTPQRWLQAGDELEIHVDGIGTLSNRVQ